MATQVQNRRGTTAEHSSFTGAVGELTVDTDKDVVVVHDGSTAGGHPMLKQDGSNSALALGSAASPSLKWDANTGIYSPGADQLAISTNGTGRLFVDASGQIGARVTPNAFWGSDYPAIQFGKSGAVFSRVAVNDQTSFSNNVFVNSANQEVRLETGTAHIYRMGGSGHTWYSAASGTGGTVATMQEYMRLDSSGRLGLGTSSPAYRLDVINNSSYQLRLATGTGDYTDGGLYLGASGTSDPNYYGYLRYLFSSKTTDLAASGNGITFRTVNAGSGSPAERMRIDSSGRVGIGTTAPAHKLTVSTGVDTDAGDITIGLGSVTAGATRQATITKNTTSPWSLTFAASNGGTSVDTIFKNSGTNETARLDGYGRLLVGTSSQSGGSLLQVNDNRIRIATAKTPASATDTGVAGEICWDANYVYVCTATNTWKRTAISTW